MIIVYSFVFCVSLRHMHLHTVDVPSLIWLKNNSHPSCYRFVIFLAG